MNQFKEMYLVRNAHPEEYDEIGKLMVNVFSDLEGFPKPEEQPKYYELLKNIGRVTQNPGSELLVAVSADNIIAGTVVFIGDMKYYGQAGKASEEKNAAGFRLLAVDNKTRGNGIGKLLTGACIEKARQQHAQQVIIHSTEYMQRAWKMYESMGFKRSADLDFMQGDLPVLGFRLKF